MRKEEDSHAVQKGNCHCCNDPGLCRYLCELRRLCLCGLTSLEALDGITAS